MEDISQNQIRRSRPCFLSFLYCILYCCQEGYIYLFNKWTLVIIKKAEISLQTNTEPRNTPGMVRCCGESNLTISKLPGSSLHPNQTTWAENYNGTMYWYSECYGSGEDPPNVFWTVLLDDNYTDIATYNWCWGCSPPHYSFNSFNLTGLNSTIEWNSSCVNTTFGVTQPRNFTLDKSVVEVNTASIDAQTRNITIAKCQTTLNFHVSVSAPNGFYDTQGKFDCPNKGSLFTNSGTPVTNSNTKCLSTAQWDRENVVECWFAPAALLYINGSVGSTFTVIENNTLLLDCYYTDEYPVGFNTVYYEGLDIYANVTKATAVQFIPTREDNNLNVSCQAVTPYTEYDNELGRSQVTLLDVQYHPYNVHMLISTLVDVAKSGETFLLNLAQNVTFHCLNDANPLANCSVYHKGKNVKSNNIDCQITELISFSRNVSCFVENDIGNGQSEELQLIVVESRKVIIDNSVGGTIMQGDNVVLKCSVDYQNQLDTSFQWNVTTQSQKFGWMKPVINITSISKHGSGNYTCRTEDQFAILENTIHINVLYPPTLGRMIVSSSNSSIENEYGVFLEGVQTATFDCSSEANPPATCEFQIGKIVQTESSCVLSQTFTETTSVFCNASNIAGSSFSQLNVTVVTERSSQVTLPVVNTTFVKAGENAELSCSVDYYVQLNTQFEWQIPDQIRDINPFNNVLSLTDLTRLDLGTYVCKTSDAFGNSTNEYYLNVTYSPEEIEGHTNCQSDKLVNGSCFVMFTSNPPSFQYKLTKNGININCPDCILTNDEKDATNQTFVFIMETSAKTEVYELRIKSPMKGFNDLVVEFQIFKESNTPGGNGYQTVIIAASVVGAFAFIILLVVALFCWRRKFSNKSSGNSHHQSRQSSNRNVHSENLDEYSTVDVSQKSVTRIEKEERINPIYGASGDPDALPDAYVVEQSSEKEERTNPLYGGLSNVGGNSKPTADKTTVTGAGGETYAQVDLRKKVKVKLGTLKRKKPDCKSREESGMIPDINGSAADMKQVNEGYDNPVYSSSEVAANEDDCYAVVDKTKKEPKSEKEEKQNPLYGSYPVPQFDLHSNMASTSRASFQTTELNGDTCTQVDKHTQEVAKPETSNVFAKQKPPKPPIKKKPVFYQKGVNGKTE